MEPTKLMPFINSNEFSINFQKFQCSRRTIRTSQIFYTMKTLWAFMAVLIVPLLAQIQSTKVSPSHEQFNRANKTKVQVLLQQAQDNAEQIKRFQKKKVTASAFIDENYAKNPNFSPRIPKIGRITTYKNGYIPHWHNSYQPQIFLTTWPVISPFKYKGWVCLFKPNFPALIEQKDVKLKYRSRLVVGFSLYLTHELKHAFVLEVLINHKVLAIISIKYKSPHRIQFQSNYFKVDEPQLTLSFRVTGKGYEQNSAHKYLAISNVYLGRDVSKIAQQLENLYKTKIELQQQTSFLYELGQVAQQKGFLLQSHNGTSIRYQFDSGGMSRSGSTDTQQSALPVVPTQKSQRDTNQGQTKQTYKISLNKI